MFQPKDKCPNKKGFLIVEVYSKGLGTKLTLTSKGKTDLYQMGQQMTLPMGLGMGVE